MTTPVEFKGSRPPNADAIPVVRSIFDFSAEALGELKTWLEASGLAIPITQIIGFSQFTIQGPNYVGATETTASAIYTDLATAGPSLTSLPNGMYLFWFGAIVAGGGAGSFSRMSLKYNSTEAVDGDNCQTESTSLVSISRAQSARLSNAGNNTVTARYRTAGLTGTFAGRWLIALRISN